VAVCLPRLLHCSTSTIAPSWPRPSTEHCHHPYTGNILFRTHSMVLAPATGTRQHDRVLPCRTIVSCHAPLSCLALSCLALSCLEPHPRQTQPRVSIFCVCVLCSCMLVWSAGVLCLYFVSLYAVSQYIVSLYVGMPIIKPQCIHTQVARSLC